MDSKRQEGCTDSRVPCEASKTTPEETSCCVDLTLRTYASSYNENKNIPLAVRIVQYFGSWQMVYRYVCAK